MLVHGIAATPRALCGLARAVMTVVVWVFPIVRASRAGGGVRSLSYT